MLNTFEEGLTFSYSSLLSILFCRTKSNRSLIKWHEVRDKDRIFLDKIFPEVQKATDHK